MTLNVYDYKILSPAKCGSRYLDMIYDTENCPKGKTIIPKGSKIGSNTMYQIKKVVNSPTLDVNNIDWDKIEWVVVRPPLELTISAIHTDLMMFWNGMGNNKVDEENLIRLFSKNETGHYHNELYRTLCFMWMKSGKKIKFIHLNDLTDFCEDVLGEKIAKNEVISFDKKMFDFSNLDIWFKKDDIFNYFKKIYPDVWSEVNRSLSKENFFWEQLVRDAEFYRPNKEELSIEI